NQYSHGIHYAVFDTDFHRTIPEYSRIYGINVDFYKKGIKKYGFHGISYSYVLRKMSEFLNKKNPNLIILHLGSGCSICAVKEGKSIDTSMGFSPLEGLIMQNRPGDIDPGLVLYLFKKGYIDYEDLYFRSGFTSIAKVKNFSELEEKYLLGENLGVLAMKSFIHRIVKYIGSYHILLNDIDGIVFTGGIGENSSLVRKLICEKIKSIGISIDDQKNKNNDFKISDSNSKIHVYVIKTNEEEEMLKIVLKAL
ncbi:MAG: acetate/propionate family kinase, partial [Elusimicrobiota bacterium]|nr:acetate/propionate family kinase [Endomicrobiia bacterium]MDW8166557.1 acetate/propionate family kinase [Elusimicrobiota bacterium]